MPFCGPERVKKTVLREMYGTKFLRAAANQHKLLTQGC
jgi:hypothetical protein